MEYELTDFHASEPELQPCQFGYAVYSENIRHTINMKLKLPIRKHFSYNCNKFII